MFVAWARASVYILPLYHNPDYLHTIVCRFLCYLETSSTSIGPGEIPTTAMAFHQPTARQSSNRTKAPVALQNRPSQINLAIDSQAASPAAVEGSQTWVLFSPADDATTTTSYLSSLQTPGRSRASELGSGSLNTVGRSDLNSVPENSAVRSVLSVDDDELDGLDSHLPEFRTALHQHSDASHSVPVLPRHDGLGSFRLDTRGIENEMQEHIYAFERYNPRRQQRQREATDLTNLMQLDQLESGTTEAERISRIEAWQQEQSQLLVEAVRKETRKRRYSGGNPLVSRRREAAAAAAALEPTTQGGEWHEQDALAYASEEGEGIFSKLTRKVLRDLMGVDGRVLSMLLGEVASEDDVSHLSSSTLKAATNDDEPSTMASATGGSAGSEIMAVWSPRLVERIARELGMLVQRMYTHHPGAFSTYSHLQQMQFPYAGLPMIPEADIPSAADPSLQDGHPARDVDNDYRIDASGSMPQTMMPQFHPTISQQQQDMTQPMTHPRRSSEEIGNSGAPEQTPSTFTQQEWEQDLDVRLVFRYLRSRFSSDASKTTSSASTTRSASHHTTAAQEAAARAARVRLHHPLVGRNLARRAVIQHNHSHTAATGTNNQAGASPVSPVLQHIHQRPGGSCASQSTTARSARRPGTRRSGSFSASGASRHSSRHFWDLGCGSVASSSMIASTGPMGSWGEI